MARIHVDVLLDQILSYIETNLKTSLNLQGAYRDGLIWLPPSAIANMVNGIWCDIHGDTDIAEVQLPKSLLFTYRFRLVYVRRIDVTTGPTTLKQQDAIKILEMIYNNYNMPGLTLSGGQLLWWLPRKVEWDPPEDNLVSAVSADLFATAIQTEALVRTKI